jgi:ATP-dependent exoDNAse (exonuclease V) beta subunit
MQLRRLGAASINLYAYAELREEGRQRDAEEELRLFHVAATRARERLLLSGVVKPEPGGETTLRTPVVERIVEGFDIDRERDSTLAVPAPEPRPGLEASFAPAEIAVRVNLASPERGAELTARQTAAATASDLGRGPAPLVERRPPSVPNRPLSYTAIGAYEDCAYRFYMERVLDLDNRVAALSRIPQQSGNSAGEAQGGAARGAAVHSLLEWSRANEWREPDGDLVRRHAVAAGLDAAPAALDEVLAPVRAWLGSSLLGERVRDAGAVRAEAPLLLNLAGTVLRGSIDLLVERDGEAPLVVDYKTDRLDGVAPAERARRYEAQRDIYALAVSAARGANQVEVAYVFLERPEEPVLSTLGPAEMEAGRQRLRRTIERIAAGEFPPAAPERRDWALCDGCPALGRLCSGPEGT